MPPKKTDKLSQAMEDFYIWFGKLGAVNNAGEWIFRMSDYIVALNPESPSGRDLFVISYPIPHFYQMIESEKDHILCYGQTDPLMEKGIFFSVLLQYDRKFNVVVHLRYNHETGKIFAAPVIYTDNMERMTSYMAGLAKYRTSFEEIGEEDDGNSGAFGFGASKP